MASKRRRIDVNDRDCADATYVYISGCDDNIATMFDRLLTDLNLRFDPSVLNMTGERAFYVTDLNGEKPSKEACTELVVQLKELFPEAFDNNIVAPWLWRPLGRELTLYKKIPVMSMTDKLKQCAHAIESADHSKTGKLLSEIKSCSSPTGNAIEMMGYCFVKGLEDRLSGNSDLISQRFHKREIKEHDDILEAYGVYHKACPIQKASHVLSNQTIMDLVKEGKSVHIIDFGIGFGLQYPTLMEQLSKMVGGVPNLRITGIDMPLPGMSPGHQVNYTKFILEHFATKFNVPFEYKGIESKWEDVTKESLNVHKDEVIIVNCLSHSGYISDNILTTHGPSDPVLGLIRELNPAAFVHGRADVSLNAPSFVSCFNEALLHYSALFDMVDKNLENDDKKCLLVEIFEREIYNIVAFYKPPPSENLSRSSILFRELSFEMQGFVQCRVSPDILKNAQDMVKSEYTKDFVIKEENENVCLGWKGITLFTLSVWKPGQSSEA